MDAYRFIGRGQKQPYGTRFARDILTSFHSVGGAVFSVTGGMDSEKQKRTMTLAALVAFQEQQQKRKSGFSEGRGSNVVRSLAGARSVNDCIV